MQTKTILTIFQLPTSPAAFGLCALDQDNNLFFHPGFISDDWLTKAQCDRVLHFVQFESGFAALAPLSWARNNLRTSIPDRSTTTWNAFSNNICHLWTQNDVHPSTTSNQPVYSSRIARQSASRLDWCQKSNCLESTTSRQFKKFWKSPTKWLPDLIGKNF